VAGEGDCEQNNREPPATASRTHPAASEAGANA